MAIGNTTPVFTKKNLASGLLPDRQDVIYSATKNKTIIEQVQGCNNLYEDLTINFYVSSGVGFVTRISPRDMLLRSRFAYELCSGGPIVLEVGESLLADCNRPNAVSFLVTGEVQS